MKKTDNKNIIGIVVFSLMLLGLIGVVILGMKNSVLRDTVIAVNTISGYISMLFAAILMGFCIAENYNIGKDRMLFEIMVTITYLLALFSTVTDIFQGLNGYENLIFISCTISYVMAPIYWTVFFIYQDLCFPSEVKKGNTLPYVIVYQFLYFAIIIANIWTGLMFTVNQSGFISYTNTNNFSVTAVWSIGWGLFYLTYIYEKKCKISVKLTLSSQIIFPAILLLYSFYLSRRGFVMIETMDGIYNYIYLVPLYVIFFFIFSEQSKQLLIKDREITETTLNSMVLQISPHFIYNTLGSIASLCSTDPEKAADLTCKFSDYLRDNDSNIAGADLITFKEELNHLEHYLSIEQVRFPNITVDYKLECMDFKLPGLTVQPLVENAIKHGICKRRKSEGNITIISKETEDSYVVSVVDNGVGFSSMPDDGRKHIGIENIKTRLKILCDGKLEIRSKENVGTISTIIIPKSEVV